MKLSEISSSDRIMRRRPPPERDLRWSRSRFLEWRRPGEGDLDLGRPEVRSEEGGSTFSSEMPTKERRFFFRISFSRRFNSLSYSMRFSLSLETSEL